MISLQTLLKLVFVVYLSCSRIEAGTNKYERVKIAQGFFNPIVGNPGKLGPKVSNPIKNQPSYLTSPFKYQVALLA